MSALDFLLANWKEVLGTLLSLIYLYLSIREKASLWIFGFLSSAVYIVVFFENKLYADMSLQWYYVFVSVYGWFTWRRKTIDSTSEKLLVISRISKNQVVKYFGATIVIYLIYFFVLKYFTDSTIPYSDSVVGAFSIIATWMLAKKKIENWLVWIFVDSFAAGLYLYKHLNITAFLYIVYTLMAVVGYFQWKRNEKKVI